MTRHLLKSIPLLILFAVVLIGSLGLLGNPVDQLRQSPMIGKKIAFFDMPVVVGNETRFTPRVWAGKVVVVNIFASWCEPCIAEHPELMALSGSGKVTVLGIAWRDKHEKVLEWLRLRGNPYQVVGLDISGKSGISLGASGVPETYVIDKKGILRYVYRSQLTADIIRDDIVPLVTQLQAEHVP
jgi:DsbE subfamily thiol:disulfide oxidoreductase